MPGKNKKTQTAEPAGEKTADTAPMAVNQAVHVFGGKPLPIEEPGRSYLSILTEGDDDDLEQLPKLPKRVGGPGRPLDHQLLADDERGWTILNNLIKIQCTIQEVAAVFGRSTEWIRGRVRDVHGCTYGEYADQIRPLGMIALRRKQMQLAMSGDRNMLIFLGKQYLNQAEKSEAKVGDPDGKPLASQAQLDPADVVLQGLATIAQRQQLAQQARASLAASNAEGPSEGTPVKIVEAERAPMETIQARVRTLTTRKDDVDG